MRPVYFQNNTFNSAVFKSSLRRKKKFQIWVTQNMIKIYMKDLTNKAKNLTFNKRSKVNILMLKLCNT